MKLNQSPISSAESRQSVNYPQILTRVLSTATLVLALVGCVGNQKKPSSTDQMVSQSAKKAKKEKTEEISTPISTKLTSVEQLDEKHCFSTLRRLSQEIVKNREIFEIHELEMGLDGANEKKLKKEMGKCVVNMEYSAIKAFQMVIETNPRCWPRLLKALIDMTKKNPEVKELESYGEIEKSLDSPAIKEFQGVMYKELTVLLASLVAECDADLKELRKITQYRLDEETMEKLTNQIDQVIRIRTKFITSLENGTLLPNRPLPEKGFEEKLLKVFHQMRSKKGGLPEGNSTGPDRVRFGDPKITHDKEPKKNKKSSDTQKNPNEKKPHIRQIGKVRAS